MEFKLVDYNDYLEQEIDEIIDSYKTSFWIDQHKWFIQCYSNTEDDQSIIYLHTLSYKFEQFSINVNDNENFIFKSTCSQDDHYLLYNSVQNLDYCYTISKDMNLSKTEFRNIRYLILIFPYNDHFQSIVPRLENLISLQIKMITWYHNDNNLLQLQSLFDQTFRVFIILNFIHDHRYYRKMNTKIKN